MAPEHTMHMQKALSQMNIQLLHVLNDITGVSGMAILYAILRGERDSVKLAAFCNWRVGSSRGTIAKSLERLSDGASVCTEAVASRISVLLGADC
jgi:hypothetical protein